MSNLKLKRKAYFKITNATEERKRNPQLILGFLYLQLPYRTMANVTIIIVREESGIDLIHVVKTIRKQIHYHYHKRMMILLT